MRQLAGLLFVCLCCPQMAAAEQLSLEDRVTCAQSIEEVYAKHRTTSDGSPATAFSFDREAARARVEDMLRQSQALQSVWGRPLTSHAISAEISRVEDHTHDFARLKELYAALNNDPMLVGECLIRPILTERLIRSAYSNDRRLHESVRATADSGKALLEIGVTPGLTSSVQRTELSVSKLSASDLAKHFPSGIVNTADTTKQAIDSIRGHVGPIVESPIGFDIWRVSSSGTVESWRWEKVPFETWWHKTAAAQEPSLDVVTSKAVALNVAAEAAGTCEIGSWSLMRYSDDFAPKSQNQGISVWDGSEMLVFGAAVTSEFANPSLPGGAVYSPATDSWHAMSHVNQPDYPSTVAGLPAYNPYYIEGVWTGTELIVWGGCETVGHQFPYEACFQTGARYNPSSDMWTTMSEAGAPAVGPTKSLTWTGSRMFAWSGSSGGAGLYDPQTNTWTSAATPPIGGSDSSTTSFFAAVWSGTEVLEFGYFGSNAAYNPTTNQWRTISSTGAPHSQSSLGSQVGVKWTGLEALLLTDYDPPPYATDFFILYRYNPSTDSWSQASTSGMPTERSQPLLVWAGDRLIMWGGLPSGSSTYVSDGAMYFPSSNTWAPIRNQGAPAARTAAIGVWDGQEVLVWGGTCSDLTCWTGGRLNVASNAWTPMAYANDGAPFGRRLPGAASDGTKGYIWGGDDLYGGASDGGIYDPTLDVWNFITGLNAPVGRGNPSMTVNAGLLSVFGGEQGNPTGGIYNLQSRVWTSIASPWGSEPQYPAVGNDGNYIVAWGGDTTNTGYVYNLTSNQWTAMSTTNAPAGRAYAVSVEHAGAFYVYGGTGLAVYDDGGIYNPATNAWSSLLQSGDIPTTYINQGDGVLVDLGSAMLLWITSVQQAWTYNYSTHVWIKSTMSGYAGNTSSGVPPSIVWSGKEALFFGGSNTVGSDERFVPNGWAYNPATDQWRALETYESPDGRSYSAGLMTGQYMMIWGGSDDPNGGAGQAYTGGLYCTDTRTGPLSAAMIASASFDHPTFGYLDGPDTLHAYAHNGGADTATGVHLSVDTGADLAFEGLVADPADSCTTPTVGNTGVVDCTLGTLDVGATRVIQVQMSPFAMGTFSANATVTANENNPNPAAAQSTAPVKIIAAADYVFSGGF